MRFFNSSRLLASLCLLGIPGAASAERGLLGALRSTEAVTEAEGNIPQLESLLRSSGWEPTPELSGAFHVGDIFDERHQWQAGSCFSAETRTSTYTETEMIAQFQAGVRMGGDLLPLRSAAASGGIIKQVKFGTPSHILLPGLGLHPSDSCRTSLEALLQSGKDISGWYVIKEVLIAEISEQTCGRLDASGSFAPVGEAEAEIYSACSRVSLEPVTVAYRTIPIIQALGVAGPEYIAEALPAVEAEPEEVEREEEPEELPPPVEPSTLWFLSEGSLYQLSPESQEPVKVVNDYRLKPGTNGGAAFSEDGSSLYTWGASGLMWVNMATARAELLSASGTVLGAWLLGDGVLLYSQRKGYSEQRWWGWSSEQGKGIRLDSDEDPIQWAWSTPGSDAVVLQHSDRLRIITREDISHSVVMGQAVAGIELTDFSGLHNNSIAAVVDPSGEKVVIASSAAHPDHPEYASSPLTFHEVNVRTGRTRKLGSHRGDSSVVYNGFWDEGPVLVLSSCNDCGDPGQAIRLKGGNLAAYAPTDTWPETANMDNLEVRMVQGQPELFSVEGGQPRQLTDIRNVRPKKSPSPYGSYGYEDECEDVNGLAWTPWLSGQHVLVASIVEVCEAEAGSFTEAVTVLVDLEQGPTSQVVIKSDVGSPWPYEKSDNEYGYALTRFEPLSNWDSVVTWSQLGLWSPDGARLVTPSGTIITSEGETWTLKNTPQWLVWR